MSGVQTLPCARCGAAAGEPCVRRDNLPAARSHMARRPIGACGTKGGYQRHLRLKEQPCDPCRDANRRYMQQYRSDNPGRRDADIDGLKARRRAIRRLIALHPNEFRRLLEDETSGRDGTAT